MRKLLNWLRDLLFEKEGSTKPGFFDGDGTKLVFDHVRNFTIAFLVAQAGLVALSLDPEYLAIAICTKTLGILFVLSAIGLFILNFLHGERLLEKSLRKSWFSKLVFFGYWTLYFFSSLAATMFNVIRRL